MIGFYDSGLGGLTVLKVALSMLPDEEFLYYGDTKNNPYGEKTAEEVIQFANDAANYLVEKGAGCIVVACNAASSAAGEFLRQNMNVPIVCMEPAINLAEKNNRQNKRILVLSTNLTLQLEKYRKLKEKLACDNIDELPLPQLVRFAESFKINDQEVRAYLKEKLGCFNLNDYSFIVLGCTHFSFYNDVLQSIVPPDVKVIDGNIGTVNQLIKVYGKSKSSGSKGSKAKIDIHLTAFDGDIAIKNNIINYLNEQNDLTIQFS